MFRKLAVAAAATFMLTAGAYADPIEGTWLTGHKVLLKISPCGGSFCITVASGAHKGKSAGSMAAAGGGSYKGSVTRVSTGKTYKGSGKLSGNTLRVKGCVAAVLCESQTWTRQ